MKGNLIWTCFLCEKNYEYKSNGKCPKCGRKLVSIDMSKMPDERKPEWPEKINKADKAVQTARIDYTHPGQTPKN